jgi:hypothetical protein
LKNVFGRSWGGRKWVATAPTRCAQSSWWLPQGGLQIRQVQLEKGGNERSRVVEAETHDWTALIRETNRCNGWQVMSCNVVMEAVVLVKGSD